MSIAGLRLGGVEVNVAPGRKRASGQLLVALNTFLHHLIIDLRALESPCISFANASNLATASDVAAIHIGNVASHRLGVGHVEHGFGGIVHVAHPVQRCDTAERIIAMVCSAKR